MVAEIKESYAKAIVKELLCLRAQDALSINAEDLDFEFAKLVADQALQITHSTVKIVVTENGKPVQVMDFEPEFPAMDGKMPVMLRISHKRESVVSGPTISLVVDPNDMIAIQRFGHLADPIVLDRRIGVPWCVANVYDDSDIESWEAVSRKIELGIQDQGLSSKYRSRDLGKGDIRKIAFIGEKGSLEVGIPKKTVFVDGNQALRSGREFLNSFDFDRLSFNVDRASASGSVHCKARVLGKDIETVLVFKDGMLTDWTHCSELDQILGFDENLRRIGYITMRDNEFTLNLGCSLVESLGEKPESEEDLPGHFNNSLYTIRFVMDRKMDVLATNGEQKTWEVAKKGYFLA